MYTLTPTPPPTHPTPPTPPTPPNHRQMLVAQRLRISEASDTGFRTEHEPIDERFFFNLNHINKSLATYLSEYLKPLVVHAAIALATTV
ncbi:hypothetical protein EVAR_50907_1 [Eumeta japonica]|uniref:Uncharacterized protein n=1 Tax=Eumeta variegata TaxID=151549 RepID=A0A4C1YE41_EUMVA|nr:hypothetical protein EVAR_50907_1 [Eumeta japonica]